MPEDTLTITDNRTGQTYTVPVENGTIRAMDLRQIKTGPDDFGLMTYDPAFMNTASCRSSDHLSSMATRAFCVTAAIPSRCWPRTAPISKSLTCCCSANCPPPTQLNEWVYDITHHTMLHETTKKFMRASATTPIPWACWSARWRRFPPSIPMPEHARSAEPACCRSSA